MMIPRSSCSIQKAMPAPARRGLTLIELMMVMGIMGIVFGLGLGAFSRLETPGRQTMGVVQSVLRAASNQAVAHQTTTRVGFDASDPDVARIWPAEVAVVGTWHFEEDSLRGAFGLFGDGVGHRLVDDGYIGRGLSVAQVGSEVRFRVQDDAGFDLADGFALEVAIRDNSGRGGRVLNIGRVIGIDLTAKGGVRGWFTPDHAENDRTAQAALTSDASRATHLFTESPDGIVLPGNWSLVRLEYDRRRLLLTVDGVPVDQLESDLPVRQLVGPMTVSSTEDEGFRGEIDKLVVSAVDQGEAIKLPDLATFVAPTPPLVIFAGGGGLDPSVHDRTVEVVVRFADGREESVFVNPFGTVE